MKAHGGTFVSILLALMLFAGAVVGAEASQCTATAAGFNGDVTVSLTVENGKLASVEVKGDGETEGVGSRALEIMPELMLAGNTVDVDIVTGATFTSNAILTAAKAALAESGAVLSATDINIEQHMKPGTYTGEAYGKWGKTTVRGLNLYNKSHGTSLTELSPTVVEITVDEEKILDVKVAQCGDNEGYIEVPIERIPRQIVENQTIAVEAVSGATMTSNAILNASKQALEAAGANIAGFMTPIEKATGLETYNCDLVIVGGGGSGTVAALTAIEKGLDVIVIEKNARVGGQSSCTSGGFAVESKYQKEINNPRTIENTFEFLMDWSDWKANSSLVMRMLKLSGGTIEMLQDHWDKTDVHGITEVNKEKWALKISGGVDRYETLYSNFIEPLGGKLLRETRADKLIKDENSVLGVHANKADGTEVEVYAKNTLVCTGGFAGNKEMLEKYFGHSHFYLYGLSTNEGDGINMCLDAGAIISDEIEPHVAEFCGNEVLPFKDNNMQYICQAGFLALDPLGERFVNEEFFTTQPLAIGATALRRTGYAYIVFTQKDFDAIVEKGLWGVLDNDYLKSLGLRSRILVEGFATLPRELQEALDAGEAWKADTLEDLGAAIGFDDEVYSKSIADYQQVLAAGDDTLFGKCKEMQISLDEGPYYAVRVCATLHGTYNGIRVNKYQQALDKDFGIVPGLYVSGQDSGGFFSNPYYWGEGWTQGYAWTSGRNAVLSILGENVE